MVFQSKSTDDYHEAMNSDEFEEWIMRILPLLAENCVIVMENAPFHCVKLEKKNREPLGGKRIYNHYSEEAISWR